MNPTTSAFQTNGELAGFNEICLNSFGPRTIDLEFRDCRMLLDGDLGSASGGDEEKTAPSKRITARQVINRYHAEGEAFLSDVKGGFRLALWDRPKQKLIVVVDPFATKPVYYVEKDGQFAFGAKLSDLTRLDLIDRQIDPNVLFFYLNHSFVPAPYSIYQGMRRLQPGQYLVWQNQRLDIKQYWDIEYNEDFTMTEQAAAERVYAGVEQALKFYISGDSRRDRTGAFLSGGTDSSTLVGLLSKMQSTPVKAFSVGFTELAYNEIDYARIAAKHFGAEAHEYFVSADDALQAMPILAASFDEPFGNSSAIPTYFCLRAAQEAGVDVMLAGDGGDELFAGNERYLTERVFLLYDRLPPQLQRLSVSLGKLLPSRVFPFTKARRYLERASEPNPERFYYYQLYLRQTASEYFTRDFLAQIDPEFALMPSRFYYGQVPNAAPLNRLLYMDLKMCIADNDLFKVNRMAEALDIRVCYPYLDRDLAELTGRIPARLKLKGATKRYIFKQAFQKLLPRQILHKTKHGFGLPVAGWLRRDHQFRDLARSLLLDQVSVGRGYFERSALETLLEKHDDEASDFYGTYIWYFMMLELWHRRHFADKSG
jgi:asparagine synthase (glutamine-hydrolysing)